MEASGFMLPYYVIVYYFPPFKFCVHFILASVSHTKALKFRVRSGDRKVLDHVSRLVWCVIASNLIVQNWWLVSSSSSSLSDEDKYASWFSCNVKWSRPESYAWENFEMPLTNGKNCTGVTWCYGMSVNVNWTGPTWSGVHLAKHNCEECQHLWRFQQGQTFSYKITCCRRRW
jgi:hypothetical protein